DPRATPAFDPGQPGAFGLVTDGAYYTTPTTADLDGDGDLDVISGTRDGDFLYFENSGTVQALTASLGGTTGYRMLAAPGTATFGTLLGTEIYTQGFPGALQPTGPSTVYLYDEAVPGVLTDGYATPGSLTDPLLAGTGAFVYVFEDEDPRPSAPETQGGFPKTLRATGRPALVDFDWGTGGDAPLSFTDTGSAIDDGWNLLGNPFGSWFDWDGVDLEGVNAPVYVYDNVAANYLSHSRGIPNAGSLLGGIVGPFQGFWAQTNGADAAITARPSTSNGGPLYRGSEAQAPTVVGLRVRPGVGSALPAGVQSEAFLALGVGGSTSAVDSFDAFALTPPAASYLMLATEAAMNSPAALLSIDARPVPGGVVTVELDLTIVANAATVGGPLVLDWPNLALPAGWSARLLDRQTGERIDLAPGGSFPFTLAGLAPAEAPQPDALGVPAPGRGPVAAQNLASGRFALVVTPDGATAGEGEAVQELALSAARPNPTTGSATLVLTLPAASAVEVGVYDVLGRRVAVLAEGTLGAGDHTLRVAPGALAAGTYVVRAAVGDRVLAQRMTVTR
ncbi:MAG TPA: T9SS type A sorting domain-containing protein, partial [Rubricoccaceae bacterium]